MFSKEATNPRDGRESRRGFRDERYVSEMGTNAVACPPAVAGSSSGSHLRRELPILPELTEEEAEVFGTNERNYRKFSRRPIMVHVNGEDLPPFLERGFAQCSVDEALRQNIHKAGLFWPSPIQRYAIPGLLAGCDLYVVSEANAGKIAAFVLPMVQLVLAQEVLELTAPQPYVIIVTPTCRTAAKTYAEARKFAYGTPVKVCVVDSSSEEQQRQIASGCHILVVTPRWLAHLKTVGTVTFRNVKAVVLHEADQIIQLGLRQAIEFFMNDPTLPAKQYRQMVIYSLSMNGLVHDLAVEYLTRPISVIVKVVGGTSQDILQTIHRVEQSEKRSKLEEILRGGPIYSTLVFVLDRQSAELLAAHLSDNLNIPTAFIFDGMTLPDQQQLIRELKAGRKLVAVATPDAIDGPLKIPIHHVINYDMPKYIGDYVSCIAQTGRFDRKGRATSFYDPRTDRGLAEDLMKILFQCQQKVPDFLLETEPAAAGSAIAGSSGLTVSAELAEGERKPKKAVTWEDDYSHDDDDDDELIDVVN